MKHRLISIFLGLGGILVSYSVSPLFPPTSPRLFGLIQYPPASDAVWSQLLSLNFLLLLVVATISLALPIVAFALVRKRWAFFAWGLLIGVLVTGIPGYLFLIGGVFLANY